MRYAVADTGSNTIRLAVYDYENGTLNQLYNEAIFANLASHIQNNRLTESGIQAATDAILTHKAKAAEYDCELHVFATAAIRNAENCTEICEELKKRTGIAVDLISGDDEALLSFCGASLDFPVENGVMADVGGGSSEVILFHGDAPEAFYSVPWGGLKAFCDFVGEGLPDQSEVDTIKEAITKVLKEQPLFAGKQADTLCIVGGSVRAATKLAKAFFGKETLNLTLVDKLLQAIVDDPAVSWALINMHAPKRATTIAPALAIYSAVGHYFGAEHMLLSDNGIKEGYVIKRLIP